jgi:formate dehydrogenase subunit delta
MPDRTEALDGIATHIRKFWEPRMRRELLLALDRAEGAESAENPGLSPIVHAALLAHRERLAPASLV